MASNGRLLSDGVLHETTRLARFAARIADPLRLQITHALLDGRWKSAVQLAEATNLAQAVVDRELAELIADDGFERRKAFDGDEFRFADPALRNFLRTAIRLVDDN